MLRMESKSMKSMFYVDLQDSSLKENLEELKERYSKMKDILKQVTKDLTEEKEKRGWLLIEFEKLVLDIKEKDTLLEHLQTVSEAVVDEYSVLRVKCDLESEAATNASKRATKYFEENQKLKEGSQHKLVDTEISERNEVTSQEPNPEESISEVDVLSNLASELRTEIASLNVQLTKAIEKHDFLKGDFEMAKELYEKEKAEHNDTRVKLGSLQSDYDRQQAALYVPETAVHRIEETTAYHWNRLKTVTEDSVKAEPQYFIDNYRSSVGNLDWAERQITHYSKQNASLIARVQELEFENGKLLAEASASIPKPPPPPPPPPPAASFNPIKSLMSFMNAGKKSAKIKKEVETPHEKAVSEMIKAIKKGQIHLKPTPKTFPSRSSIREASAMGEMKSLLSTLKKKDNESFPRENRESIVPIADSADEELKILLRKRSLKSITDPSTICAVSIPEEKSVSADDDTAFHADRCISSALKVLEFTSGIDSDHCMENKAECLVSTVSDTLITSENQNLTDVQVHKNISDI